MGNASTCADTPTLPMIADTTPGGPVLTVVGLLGPRLTRSDPRAIRSLAARTPDHRRRGSVSLVQSSNGENSLTHPVPLIGWYASLGSTSDNLIAIWPAFFERDVSLDEPPMKPPVMVQGDAISVTYQLTCERHGNGKAALRHSQVRACTTDGRDAAPRASGAALFSGALLDRWHRG